MSRPLTSVTYSLARGLYVALTNQCNAVSLIQSRGPGFVMPPASGFAPLPDGSALVRAQASATLSKRALQPRELQGAAGSCKQGAHAILLMAGSLQSARGAGAPLRGRP